MDHLLSARIRGTTFGIFCLLSCWLVAPIGRTVDNEGDDPSRRASRASHCSNVSNFTAPTNSETDETGKLQKEPDKRRADAPGRRLPGFQDPHYSTAAVAALRQAVARDSVRSLNAGAALFAATEGKQISHEVLSKLLENAECILDSSENIAKTLRKMHQQQSASSGSPNDLMKEETFTGQYAPPTSDPQDSSEHEYECVKECVKEYVKKNKPETVIIARSGATVYVNCTCPLASHSAILSNPNPDPAASRPSSPSHF